MCSSSEGRTRENLELFSPKGSAGRIYPTPLTALTHNQHLRPVRIAWGPTAFAQRIVSSRLPLQGERITYRL